MPISASSKNYAELIIQRGEIHTRRGTITVDAKTVGNALEVSVSDTGIGIATEDQDKIFKEFSQASGVYANKQEGTGLGLTLTRRFVELHNGLIRVNSELGHGATFTFTLPIQQ